MSKEHPSPVFELTLQQSHKSPSANEPTELKLRKLVDVGKNRVRCKIKELEVTKGELFVDGYSTNQLINYDRNQENHCEYAHAQRQADMDGKRVNLGPDRLYYNNKVAVKLTVGSEFYLDYGSIGLLFNPSGEVGEASIKLTLESEELGESSVSLVLEIKSTLTAYIKTFERIYINQAKKVSLNIDSHDKGGEKAEYAVKKIEAKYGELQFENGEVLKAGSKLGYGNQQLIFKMPKNEELENMIKQDSHVGLGGYYPGKVKSDIKLTIVDDKGNEISTSDEFEIYAVEFHVGVKNIRWSKYDPEPLHDLPFSFGVGTDSKNSRFDEGFIEVNLDIKDTKDAKYPGCEGLQEEFGKESWKIVDCKSSDGVPVTLIDRHGSQVLGIPTDEYVEVFFRLEELNLRTNSTLTLTIEGPCESIEEVTIDIPAAQKDSLMNDKVIQFFNNVQEVNEGIVKVWAAPFKDSTYTKQEAKELSQRAEKLIAYFEKSIRQFGNRRDLLNKFHSQVLDNVKKVISAVDTLKTNKAEIDAYYGF